MSANDFVVGVWLFLIAGGIGYSMFKNFKKNKAFEQAQAIIKARIADLEKQLAALKK